MIIKRPLQQDFGVKQGSNEVFSILATLARQVKKGKVVYYGEHIQTAVHKQRPYGKNGQKEESVLVYRLQDR